MAVASETVAVAASSLEKTNWVTGLVLNVVGSFSINIGTNLIQYSHLLHTKHIDAGIQSIRASIIFCVAWFIFVIGNALNFVSFSFATQTVLSALGSVQFISNVLCTYWLFHVKPSKKQLLGTICVVLGNICIVSAANKTTFKFNSKQLSELFVRLAYIMYLVAITCISALLHFLYVYLLRYGTGEAAAAAMATSADHSTLESQPQEIPTKRETLTVSVEFRRRCFHDIHVFLVRNASLLIPTCYALISTMIGSQSVVLSKCCSSLVIESIDTRFQFDQPVSYVFLLALFVVMMFWLYRMNTALRRFDGVFIIPVLQVLWMMFGMLSGGILFKEFDGYHWYNVVGLVLGACVIFFGVNKLSIRNVNDSVDAATRLHSATGIDAENLASEEVVVAEPVSNDLSVQLTSHNSPAAELMVDPSPASLSNLNSLRNSEIGPQITESEHRQNPELPPDLWSLRAMHKIFTTTERLLEKVTGESGITHLASISNSYSSARQDHLRRVARPPPTMPHVHQSEVLEADDAYMYELNTHALPPDMSSDLVDAFHQIKEQNNSKQCDGTSSDSFLFNEKKRE
mmetsp:Transcript_12650/g.19161  ORF Transcript_12650/g.19161 Transcript_12650/m.19161 type:complete len:572 (-) Transcript_12650:274-1989(-)|eukprot:CAMPEP_0202696942 /NCGR_PEP_ID=MMETSP1385-20130828/10262_1 /ASSEMBLY_ACC=CAM_ASM_000861 /TAXON_ID=933848 /ORGANISM="Elphidium margaritaceum" /LENGTH=571 /DNA_ID=CAMNT_0049353261 /DNA_START=8 /DNA_END=1723 /DNA_ORIENTATION=-